MTATTAELPLQPTLDEQAPATADEVYDYLDELEPRLEASLGQLASLGLQTPDLFEAPAPRGSRIIVVDASNQPGNAFKYYGAAPAVLWTKEEHPAVERFVTGSAGNFSLTMGAVASRCNLGAKAHTPRDLNSVKRAAMKAQGIEIAASYDDVIDAILGARLEAAVDPKLAFLHPFNHPYLLKGQQLLARQTLAKLVSMGVSLQDSQPKEWHWQTGGRSGLTGTAVELFKQKAAGRLHESFEVHEARPARLAKNNLNARYDGLAVDQPGSWAQPIVADERFVQGYHEVSDVDVAKAAEVLMTRNKGVLAYENSALVGLASVLRQARTSGRPTTYIAVLSGRNVAPGSAEYFKRLLHQGQRSASAPRPPLRTVSNPLLSGVTAAYRQSPVSPNSQDSSNTLTEAQAAYHKQLVAWGLSLAHLRW